MNPYESPEAIDDAELSSLALDIIDLVVGILIAFTLVGLGIIIGGLAVWSMQP